MEIKYNATGARRKELVKAIAAILGAKPVYLGMPSFGYQVGSIEVTRNGTLRLPDEMAAQPLTEALAKAGFHYEGEDAMNTATEASAEGIGLTVELPAAQVNVELVEKLLEAKGGLIRKALGVTELPVETHEDKVAFPWFAKQPPEDERKAAIAFLSHLAAFSKHAKRVTAKAKPVANEKYAFRCFLLRLGFIGKEWKDERKTLLKNLSGSSAFRDGQPHEREQGSEAEQAQEVTA